MKLAVFGSTGQVGSAVVEEALAAGHEVRAFVRPASRGKLPAGAIEVSGELGDDVALRRCIAGVDAVISALGPRTNSPEQVEMFGEALARITETMRAEGVKRLVSISGAGLWLPADPAHFGRKAVSALMRLVAKHILLAKEREAAVITKTEIDWVLVRPGRIVRGPKTGRVQTSDVAPPRPKITNHDVADFMLRAACEPTWVHKAPLIG